MKKLSKHHTLLMNSLFLCFLSSPSLGVQPMTETDLEIVSATTGDNILNIFGASQAGLKIDTDKVKPGSAKLTTNENIDLRKEAITEGEGARSIAAIEIREIELKQQSALLPEGSTSSGLPLEAQRSAIQVSESTTKRSSTNETNSEINYKTANFKHQMREIDNGGVAVQRELQIDLLKLENLRGLQAEENRSAGSIYLSDWNSRGDTRIVVDP